MKTNELPIPDFFHSNHIKETAEHWNYNPNVSELFTKAMHWKQKHTISSVDKDKPDIRLLGIDLQKDFCLQDGTLFVAGQSGKGAIEDSIRISEFIYRNINILSKIKLTMDTHFLFQIFFAPFWITQEGNPLLEHTMIDLSSDGTYLVNIDPAGKLLNEHVRPNPAIASWICNGNYAWLTKQVQFYCKKLKEKGKYTLYLWPPHCLLGTEGHSIVGVIQEAVMFHNLTRGAEPQYEIKGGTLLTENYDPAAVEVSERWDGKGSIAQSRNVRFYQDLAEADALIVVGEAGSHCVPSMIEGLLNEVLQKDKSLVKKVYIVTDCMSAVTVTDSAGKILVDFTEKAENALQKFSDAGMHLVESTTPISSWPGINL